MAHVTPCEQVDEDLAIHCAILNDLTRHKILKALQARFTLPSGPYHYRGHHCSDIGHGLRLILEFITPEDEQSLKVFIGVQDRQPLMSLCVHKMIHSEGEHRAYLTFAPDHKRAGSEVAS